MRARKYNKKIEIWQTTIKADGYGGNGVTEELIARTWAKLENRRNYIRDVDFGITTTTNDLIVTLRKRNDIMYNSKNLYIKYRGWKYTINSEPINLDFDDREIQFKITKDIDLEVNEIAPVGGDAFPYKFNFELA